MNQMALPVLAKVDPLRIVIDPRLLKPTDWDLKAVADELTEYVQLARLIKATPVLRSRDGSLVVVSGEPFVRAAQKVGPPLKELICSIEDNEEHIKSLGLTVVTASEVLDEHPSDEMYDALELLAFTRVLTDEEQNTVENALLSFFSEMNANPASYGGNYVSISSFDWDTEHRKVKWRWRRNDQFGRHAVVFLNLLRQLNRNTAPLSSWNGLRLHEEIQTRVENSA